MEDLEKQPLEEPIEINGQVYEPAITHTTSCTHEWAKADSDPNSDMESYQCTKCWSGMNKSIQ